MNKVKTSLTCIIKCRLTNKYLDRKKLLFFFISRFLLNELNFSAAKTTIFLSDHIMILIEKSNKDVLAFKNYSLNVAKDELVLQKLKENVNNNFV